MLFSVVVLLGWLGHILICYHVIRPLQQTSSRILLTLFPCIFLCLITCGDLPPFEVSSIVIVASCWLTSIRLFGMTVFPKTEALTLKTFLHKLFWIYFPLQPSESENNPWPIKFYLILFSLKLLFNHWIYRWCLTCQSKVTYEKIFLFYTSLTTISYMYDLEIVLVRHFSKGRYTLQSFTNFPIFSVSLREFWGCRYNQLINTVLKESVFEPIRSQFSSKSIAGLTTFIISGLFHVHIAFVAFDDRSHLFPTFLFFLVHGIACSLERHVKPLVSKPVGWMLTHLFLLLTAPLILEPFINQGSPYLVVHPPPLFHLQWIPKLPPPDFCLQQTFLNA